VSVREPRWYMSLAGRGAWTLIMVHVLSADRRRHATAFVSAEVLVDQEVRRKVLARVIRQQRRKLRALLLEGVV
jgi:hypothetical protein